MRERLVASEGVDTPEKIVDRMEYQSYNVISKDDCCILRKGAYFVLDFGREINGGIRTFWNRNTGKMKNLKILCFVSLHFSKF